MVLHKTSTITPPWKYLMSPFGIKTTIYHVLSLERVLLWNTTWKIYTTFLQFVASGASARVTSLRHLRRCYTRIPDRLPERFRRIRITAQETPPYFWK